MDISVRVAKGIPESCKDVVTSVVRELWESQQVRPCLPGMARCRVITFREQELLVSVNPWKREATVKRWNKPFTANNN